MTDDPRVPTARPLHGIQVVSLAINLPGPAAVHRLQEFGADVTKVEPPAGDPLRAVAPAYYDQLSAGQQVVTLDLKTPADQEELWGLLAAADLLVTSSRPSSLERLGLDCHTLHTRCPRLCHVAIVGHPAPDTELAGHDLTYQAGVGTVQPPDLPRVLVADLAGAERAVGDALALLLGRDRGGAAGCTQVALSRVAHDLAATVRHGLTVPGGPLGGGLPQYAVYPAAEGYVAVAALEPHFWQRLTALLQIDGSRDQLARALAGRTARQWDQWAAEHDLPLAAVDVVG